MLWLHCINNDYTNISKVISCNMKNWEEKYIKFSEKHEDGVCYYNDEYLVVNRGASISGSMFSALELIDTGLGGLLGSLEHFKNYKDKISIIGAIQKALADIEIAITKEYKNETK